MTQPHKIVIGANDPKSASLLHKLLTNIYGEKAKIMTTNIISAELIKYANNSFLATKISFINTIANICSLLPRADVDMIAKAIGMDPRIGNQFLVAGPGFGGSCLPKDLSGFIDYCQNNGYDPILLKATAQVNKFQIEFILELLRERLRTLEDKSICILGTAFKKDTDDVRESVSINLIRELKKSAAIVSVHDPKALANTRKIFGNSIRYHVSLKEAITNSDSLILMTDWDEYKKISQKEILRTRKDRSLLIVDTRRILKIKKTGMIDYVALGRNTPISTFE
jgi:UDPglucose 6-dehydrogenase